MSFTVKKTGEWKRAIKILESMPARLPRAIDMALAQEAEVVRNIMLRRIDAGEGMAAHSPLTLAIRKATGFGGTKILIRSGTLRGSIQVVKFSGGYFIGVKRGARGSTGRGKKSIINIAKIHEEGRSWNQELTARQRRFLFWALKEAGNRPSRKSTGGGGMMSITIPARPFIGPAIEEWDATSEQRIQRRLAKLLGGDMGTA